MVAAWIAYCLLVSALIGCAALTAERGLNVYRRPVRWAWLAALVGSLALPAIAWLAPTLRPASAVNLPFQAIPLGILSAAGLDGAAGAGQGARALSAVWPALNLALGVMWVLSVLAFGTYVTAAVVRVRRERTTWKDDRLIGRSVKLSSNGGPAVVGFFRGVIVLPAWAARLEEEVLRLVFLHEEEHRRAGDQRLFTLGLLSVAATPWNPVLWWQLRRLRLAIEFDCDRRVLNHGVSTESYGEALLAVGSRLSHVPIAATAFAEPKSNLERRFHMLTSDSRSRKGLRVAAAGVLVCMLGVLSCEAPTPVSTVEVEDANPAEALAPADGDVSETPSFVPYDTPPRLQNPDEISASLKSNYPEDLKAAGTGGRVELWMYVTKDGVVENSQVKTTSGEPALDAAAEKVAASMQFEPARNEGSPTHVWVSQWITFRTEMERTLPLVIVDGEVVEGLEPADMERVNALDIDHIEILKEGAALEKYGEKGKDGVIEITTMSGGGAELLKKLMEKKTPGEGGS